MPTNGKNGTTGWVGWVYFAGILMVIMGIFQAIAGLTALLNGNFYVVTQEHLVALSYTQWGWIHLILGGVVMAAGSAVMNGRLWGRIIGVLLASLSALANFAFISAYPIWSVLIIVMDILIIYALVVHGSEAAE